METVAHGVMQRARGRMFQLIGEKWYGALSHTVCRIEAIRAAGWSNYRRLYARANSNAELRSIRLSHILYPFWFRPGTSDVTAIVQNLIRGQYSKLPMGFQPRWIVDGGGYIGDVSVYFLNRFPRARVLTFEPNPTSFALAQKNLSPYQERVTLYQRGLWSSETVLSLTGDFFTARLDATTDLNRVECIDLNTVSQTHAIDCYDLVKLDVEHAEQEILLHHSDGWLARTRALLVEFHTPAIREQCTAYLVDRGFRGFAHRELYYFFNTRLME